MSGVPFGHISVAYAHTGDPDGDVSAAGAHIFHHYRTSLECVLHVCAGGETWLQQTGGPDASQVGQTARCLPGVSCQVCQTTGRLLGGVMSDQSGWWSSRKLGAGLGYLGPGPVHVRVFPYFLSPNIHVRLSVVF